MADVVEESPFIITPDVRATTSRAPQPALLWKSEPGMLICWAFLMVVATLGIWWEYTYIVSPEDRFGRSSDEGDIAHVAGLHKQPPYWLIFLQTNSKVALMMVVFGPEKPGSPADDSSFGKIKFYGVRGLALANLVLWLGTFALDVQDLVEVWQTARLENQKQRLAAASVVFVTSSNTVCTWAMYGLFRLYNCPIARGGVSPADSIQMAVAQVREQKGTFTVLLMGISYVGLLINIFLFVLAIPAAIAYLPWLLPPFVLLFLVCAFLMNFASWRRAPSTVQENTDQPDDEERLGAHVGLDHQGTDDDEWLMAHVGSDNQGMFEYVATASAWPTLELLVVPLALRFYLGEGYWISLSKTFTDRHGLDYWHYLFSAFEGKVKFVWALMP